MEGRPSVDLNADVGEGTGHPAADLELIGVVTSVNIACGGHAGDREVMRILCSATAGAGVAVGAHPGYRDRERFGRHETGAEPAEIEELVASQVEALAEVAAVEGAAVDHVKPHGALYHRCWGDPEAAGAAAAAIAAVAPCAAVFAPPRSQLELAAGAAGLEAVGEGFVDRGYGPDGRLLPRGGEGALLAHAEAVAQALALAGGSGPAGGRVRSICIHGDGDLPLDLARAVAESLAAAGVEVRRYR